MNGLNTNILNELMPKFQHFLSTEGQKWIEERDQKNQFFEKYFSSPQRLDQLEEGTLRELIHTLWAFAGWTNKDYLLAKMLESGLPTIRSAFKHLLFDNDSLAKRFDHVRKSVKTMGVASISEILSHHDPNQNAIFNRRSWGGLIRLGVNETQLPRLTQLTGAKYEFFCKLTRNVREQIALKYPDISDLLKLDFLLYFVSLQDLPVDILPALPTPTPPLTDFDHNGVIDQLLELGDGLGFEVDKEFPVARGCRIDAIWRSRVANLGTIAYAFEVHRRGSRDSAILNLQRVRRDQSVQKVIIVSSKDELDRFRGEIESLDESFRNAVGYFEVQDLQRSLNHLQGLKDILNTLGLLGKGQ
jgi:hypothetical protein